MTNSSTSSLYKQSREKSRDDESINDEKMTNVEFPNVEEITNDKMSNDGTFSSRPKKKYDLEERTTNYGKAIIRFLKTLRATILISPLISQLIRSATSIGANYCEADDSVSRKEFIHKIAFCRKEARETKYWLTMLLDACPEMKNELLILKNEAQELNLIFSTIVNKTRRNGI